MAAEGDRLLEDLVRAQAVVTHLSAALGLASAVRDHLMVRARAAGKTPVEISIHTGLVRSRVYAILQRAEEWS